MDDEGGCGCLIIFLAVIAGLIFFAAKHNNEAIETSKRNLRDDQYLYQDKYVLNKADTKTLKKNHYEIKFSGNNVTDNSNSGFDSKEACRKVIDRYIKQFKNRDDYNYRIEIDNDGNSYLMPISTGSTTTFITQYDDAYYGRLLMDKK